MISIDVLRQLNTANHYMITEHARIRLFERNITIDDVICCVENGKIIEQYEDYIYIITAYYPDEQLWQDNFKTRRN